MLGNIGFPGLILIIIILLVFFCVWGVLKMMKK